MESWTDRARSRMKAKGYTQSDVAARLNVTRAAISHYLTGIREPGISQIKELSKMLDISISELLGDES